MLPDMFCIPVHFPAAAVPAKVCVTAQWLELNRPRQKLAILMSHSATVGSLTIAAGSSMMANSVSPPMTNVLRTSVGVAPESIQRSEANPPITAPVATDQNGNDPNAICQACGGQGEPCCPDGNYCAGGRTCNMMGVCQ